MLNKSKTAILLVFFLLSSYMLPTSVADESDVPPTLVFDQQDGLHVDGIVNLTGDSSFPLTSVEIHVWNISKPDQWDSVNSSPYLDSVVPYSDESSDSTMWSWQHSFELTSVDCTCYVEISVMEHTDLQSFGVVVYVGEEHHRPVLRPSLSTPVHETYSTQIFNSNTFELDYNVLLPTEQVDSFPSTSINILSNVRICPASYGICLDNYTSIDASHVLLENELRVIVDVDANLISDGFYQLQVQVQDDVLRFSNNVTQFIVIDQTMPIVQLNAIDAVDEAGSIVVDIDVDDGYAGSTFVITWSITQPDGTPRAVLDTEILDDSRLEFIPTKSGSYVVNALVRDLGGHLVVVSHNVSVSNIAPNAVLRYDGFLVENGTEITIPKSGDWVFSANESSDTTNDQTTLSYYWFVDGKALLSGKSYLSSSDIQTPDYREIRVEVVDDDGESANISFLVRQQTDSTQTFSDSSLSLGIALFFILSIVVIAVMRQRSSSDGPSGFVKWTERGKEPKN